jgi:signal transduction histidine kinase
LNNIIEERTHALIQTNEYLEHTLAEVEEKQAELFLLNDQLEQSLDHLKDTQEQLILSEKFAALGELVAGVAHEINTPLGIGITLATFVADKHHRLVKLFEAGELSKSEMKEYNDAVYEALSAMVSSLNRSAEIITSFKNVAGEQSSLELRQFNVKAYFEDVLQNLKPRIKKTPHEISLICDPEIFIYNYPGVFSHILTNFIINSLVHAFTDDKAGLITIEFYKYENNCQLIYSDNGIGISEQHTSRVFDPFYTTKKGQGSTGLGLHIVHNIVTQNLKGKIGLFTEVGKGVCFTIDFPLIHPEITIPVDELEQDNPLEPTDKNQES